MTQSLANKRCNHGGLGRALASFPTAHRANRNRPSRRKIGLRKTVARSVCFDRFGYGLAHKNMLSGEVALTDAVSCDQSAISDGAGVFARTGLCQLSSQFFVNQNAVATVVADHCRLFAQNRERRAVDRAGNSFDDGELRTVNDVFRVVAVTARNFDGQRFLAAIATSLFGGCHFKRGDNQIAGFGVFDHLNHCFAFLTGRLARLLPDDLSIIMCDYKRKRKMHHPQIIFDHKGE